MSTTKRVVLLVMTAVAGAPRSNQVILHCDCRDAEHAGDDYVRRLRIDARAGGDAKGEKALRPLQGDRC